MTQFPRKNPLRELQTGHAKEQFPLRLKPAQTSVCRLLSNRRLHAGPLSPFSLSGKRRSSPESLAPFTAPLQLRLPFPLLPCLLTAGAPAQRRYSRKVQGMNSFKFLACQAFQKTSPATPLNLCRSWTGLTYLRMSGVRRWGQSSTQIQGG